MGADLLIFCFRDLKFTFYQKNAKIIIIKNNNNNKRQYEHEEDMKMIKKNSKVIFSRRKLNISWNVVLHIIYTAKNKVWINTAN